MFWPSFEGNLGSSQIPNFPYFSLFDGPVAGPVGGVCDWLGPFELWFVRSSLARCGGFTGGVKRQQSAAIGWAVDVTIFVCRQVIMGTLYVYTAKAVTAPWFDPRSRCEVFGDFSGEIQDLRTWTCSIPWAIPKLSCSCYLALTLLFWLQEFDRWVPGWGMVVGLGKSFLVIFGCRFTVFGWCRRIILGWRRNSFGRRLMPWLTKNLLV